MDPNFCMETPEGEVVQLTNEFLAQYGGPLPANVWSTDLKGQMKLKVELEQEEGDEEANREIFDLLFDKVQEVEMTYTIKYWEMLGVSYPNKWPIHPHCWFQGI